MIHGCLKDHCAFDTEHIVLSDIYFSVSSSDLV